MGGVSKDPGDYRCSSSDLCRNRTNTLSEKVLTGNQPVMFIMFISNILDEQTCQNIKSVPVSF